jgi:hypothetical protein
VGAAGEAAVKKSLERHGWLVRDLNALRRNEPNVDLVARKDGLAVYIQVKAYNNYGWISGGGINAEVCFGGSLFNKAKNAPLRCDFVICPTPASPGDKKIVRNDWRYFVMPVEIADRLFRINIDAYFNSPKRDGSPRAKKGACQDWVGPGPIRASTVPDHQEDYRPFENNFQILEKSGRKKPNSRSQSFQ